MNNTRQSLPFLYVTVVTANTTFNVIVTCLIVLIIIEEEYNTYLWCQGGTFREWFCTVYADAINTDGRWREIEHRWNVLERFLHFCYLGTQCLIPGSLYRAKHTMPSHLPNCSKCTLRNYSLLTSKLDWQLNTRICMHEPWII